MLSLSRSRGGTRRQHHYFETTPEGIQRLNPPGLISFLLPMLCQSAKPKAKGQAQGRPCPVLRSEYCLQARVSSRAHAAVVSLYICVTGSSSRPAAARLAAREGGTEDTLYIITLCNNVNASLTKDSQVARAPRPAFRRLSAYKRPNACVRVLADLRSPPKGPPWPLALSHTVLHARVRSEGTVVLYVIRTHIRSRDTNDV